MQGVAFASRPLVAAQGYAEQRQGNQPTAGRLAYLDGLRGVAILSVLVYHAYARWPTKLPFGDAFEAPPIAQGWVGVELFFIISGFVIFMSLERSRSLPYFALQRWRRLFPAMLVATMLVVLTTPLLPERPYTNNDLAAPLVGLTFIAPRWWAVAGIELEAIEGAFWSLFVEVQFYAVVGIAYFASGRRGALMVLAALYVAAQLAVSGLLPSATVARLIFSITDKIGAIYYAWFLAGAFLYLYLCSGRRVMLMLGVASLAAAVLLFDAPAKEWLASKIALGAVAALAIAAVVYEPLQRHLARPFWQFLGFVSYPLYLIHENIVAALTIKLGKALPMMPHVLLPVLPMLAMIAVAWVIAKYMEPAIAALIPSAHRPGNARGAHAPVAAGT